MNRRAAQKTLPPTRTLARDTTLAAISQAASRGSLILAGIIVSRYLGPAAFADFSFLLITASLITTLTGMGLGLLATRAVAINQSEDKAHFLDERLPPLVILSVSCAALALSLALLLPGEWLHVSTPAQRVALALLSSAAVVSGVLIGFMYGSGRFDVVARSGLVSGATIIAAAILASVFGEPLFAAYGLVIGQLTTVALIAPIVYHTLLRNRLSFRGRHLGISALLDLISVAFPILLTSLIWSAAMWWGAKQLMMEQNGHSAFALYAIGLHWFSAVVFLPSALNNALLPRIFGSSNDAKFGANTRYRFLAVRGALTAGLVAMVIALGVLILQMSGILAWGYAVESQALLPVICGFMAAAVLAATSTVLGSAVIAKEGAICWLLGIFSWASIFVLLSNGLGGSVSPSRTTLALATAYVFLVLYGFIAIAKRRPLPDYRDPSES